MRPSVFSHVGRRGPDYWTALQERYERRYGEGIFDVGAPGLNVTGGVFVGLELDQFDVIGLNFKGCKFEKIHFNEGQWGMHVYRLPIPGSDHIRRGF